MLLVMSTKKIQYNPNILSSLKTKTKTQKINRPLLINQNSLKNQLISRIKNHKQNEQKEIKDIIETKEVKSFGEDDDFTPPTKTSSDFSLD